MNIKLGFGEVMLRISPLQRGKLISMSKQYLVEPGGSEANVIVALSALGNQTRFLTRVSNNQLGELVIRELSKFGVDTSFIQRCDARQGLYWTEIGNDVRASNVIYDRETSAFSSWSLDEIEWKSSFDSVDWLHISGITPALNDNCRKLILEGLQAAPKGIIVSIDLNYRSSLWRYIPDSTREKSIHQYMKEIAKRCDYIFGNESDYYHCFGSRSFGSLTEFKEGLRDFSESIFYKMPKVRGCGISLRESYSASKNLWSAALLIKEDGVKNFFGPEYALENIVDRVGSGDCFTAGLIHGLANFGDDYQKTIDFATTLGALKHTIRGDFSPFSEKDIVNALKSSGKGNIIR